MTFEEWLALGAEKGWTEQFCYTHDTAPMTDEERAEEEEHGEVCIPTLRVWIPED